MPEEETSRRISSSNANEVWLLPNNAVAESDLQAAIQAIEDTFHEATSSLDSSDFTRRMLFQDTQQSLVYHLKRIVQPISDVDFQDYIDLYHIVLDEDDDDVEDNDNDQQFMDDMVEEEIDEADLLDTNALQEAQQLRAAVRDLSQNVQEIREEVLKNSIATIVRNEYTALVDDVPNRPSVEIDKTMIDQQQEYLQQSLQALSALLQDSQWSELPKQLEDLQNTIDVVRKETDKDRPMSQTEAAIISRCNSDDENNNWDMLLSQKDGDDSRMTPSDRFARFFEQLQ